MEVLISVFVLSIGLIGLAALLPVGSLAIMETGKADRAGNCGRAGLHTIKACRMLDSKNWSDPTADSNYNGASFVVDPLGLFNNNPVKLPNAAVGPVNLTGLAGNQVATEQFFRWQDDLSFVAPPSGGRPNGIVSTSGNPQLQYDGNYSWFFTVTPAAAENQLRSNEANLPAYLKGPYHYLVSVVVCYKRDLTTGNGQNTAQANLNSDPTCGYVTLSSFSNGVLFNVKENDWIALCGQVTVPNSAGSGTASVNVCRWYRVVSVGDTGGSATTQYLSLNGPDCTDWTSAGTQPTAVSINREIIGVYTEPVELDREPLW